MRKFLIVPVFVIFLLTGYFTVSRVTTCQAQCSCGEPCIAAPNALVMSLQQVLRSTVYPNIPQAQNELEIFFQQMTGYVWDGMFPVMDWSFKQQAAWFTTFWNYNLMPSYQLMTRELSTANVEQAEALGMFSDAQNIIRNQEMTIGGGAVADNDTANEGYGGDMGIKDHREQRPSEEVCTGGSIMSSLERATAFSDSYLAWGAADKWWIGANQAGGEAAQGFANYLADRWENDAPSASVGSQPVNNGGTYGYVPNWCNAAYNNGFAGCPQDGRWAGEDVDVAGLVFAQDTIPLDLTQDPSPYRTKGDVDELVTNLAESFGKDPVTNSLAGKDGILASLSYRAKRQVVYDGLFYVISRRVPGGLRTESQGPPAMTAPTGDGVDLPDLLKEIRAETGEEGSTGCGGTNSSPCTSPNPSRNEILRAMITQQFQSGKYALRQIDEPENNQREQVIEQALQLIQMNDQMELMDHWSLLLASQISNEIVQGKGFSAATNGAPAGGSAP